MSIGFAAVFFGVVLYTAFIAEIVRGGILAVQKANKRDSLGMKSQLPTNGYPPTGLRVMMPPQNQYLNLTKIPLQYSRVRDLVQVGDRWKPDRKELSVLLYGCFLSRLFFNYF